MIRNQLVALCALLTLVVACSKKDKNGDDSAPVNADVKAVQEYLSQTENVKTFGSAFQQVTFTDADVNDGFTVFAPVNSAIDSYDPNARIEATSLTSGEVKDHIVKGIIKKADLTNGKKLITLTGKELVVTIDGDKIMINGVVILDNGSGDAKHIVFTISGVLCKKPGAAEITVLDGTLWSATDTLGNATAGADVSLYYTRADFNDNRPAFTGKTDASGKITFSGLPAGTYYLVAKKDDKRNYLQPATINGQLVAFKPVGIYQNADQVNHGPLRYIPLSIGDFMYQDVNADGVMDYNDRALAPFEVVVTSNRTVKVNSLIGYFINYLGKPFTDKAEAQMYINDLYRTLGDFWYHHLAVMDGVLSDEAACTDISVQQYCNVDKFTFTPASGVFSIIYRQGYEHITLLNRLIRNIPLLNLPADESNKMIAEMRGLRGFVYFQLATYYGGLFLQSGIPDDNQVRSSLNDTYTFIKNDLTAAMALLPNRFTGIDHRRINANACKLLLARIAMAQGDNATVKQLTGELIQTGTYSLVANASDIFVNEENAEIIWNMNTDASALSFWYYFNDGVTTRNFNPIGRYAEVLLLNTEARVNLGELDATYINQLLNRRGQQTVTFTTQENARDVVRSVWKNELYREGHRFYKLVKWGKAVEVLSANGYNSYNSLMPIPQEVIERNSAMHQNVGY